MLAGVSEVSTTMSNYSERFPAQLRAHPADWLSGDLGT